MPTEPLIVTKLAKQRPQSFRQDALEAIRSIWAQKRFRWGIFGNICYVLIVNTAFLILYAKNQAENTIFATDFRVFYTSFQLIIREPAQLYSVGNYTYPFRYLPAFSYLFSFVRFLPFPLAFVLHTLTMEAIHLASFVLIYLLATKMYYVDLFSRRRQNLLLIALVAPLQVPNLMMGQISEVYIFLMLLTILLLEDVHRKRYRLRAPYFWSGVLIGIAAIFKPFAIIAVPFLMTLALGQPAWKLKMQWKSALSALLGFVLPLAPNLIFWAKYPGLFRDFLTINKQAQILAYPSTSVTRIFERGFQVFGISLSPVALFITLFLILYGIVYFFFIKTPRMTRNYSFYFGLAHLCLLIAYPDSWFLYILMWFLISLPGSFEMEDQVRQSPTNKRPQAQKFLFLHRVMICHYGIVYFAFGILIALFWTTLDYITPLLLIYALIIDLWTVIKAQSLKTIEHIASAVD